MASTQDTNFLQQQDDYEQLTPPPTPTTATFPYAVAASDQARQLMDKAISTNSAPATSTSPSAPKTLVQDIEDEETIRPWSPTAGGTTPRAGGPTESSSDGKQKKDAENDFPDPSSSAEVAIPYDRAADLEDQASGSPSTSNDGSQTSSVYVLCDTWHDCDRCGKTVRCRFETGQTHNDDNVEKKASEEQPTVRGLLLYFTRLTALHFPLLAYLFPHIGVSATSKQKNGQAGYQDAQEHVLKTSRDRTIQRATEGEDVDLAELE